MKEDVRHLVGNLDGSQIMNNFEYLIKKCSFLITRVSWKVLKWKTIMIERLILR